MENGANVNKAVESAKETMEEKRQKMSEHEACEAGKRLIEDCGSVMVGSNGDDGYPNIKAMLKFETDGIKTVWLSTNTSSKRVAQFQKDPKACLYFVDQVGFKGLMLVGEMEVLSDMDSRKRLWNDGCRIYYPLGVTDPDYTVFRFTAKWGNYYHGLQNTTFNIE